MSANFNSSILQTGDAILYFRYDFLSWLIALKTWTKVAHVEIYLGEEASFASRPEFGVDVYQTRLKNVAAVMRPKAALDFTSANAWFQANARGQPYDWLGLLCFTLARRRGEARKMFCSEFATRFYRAAKLEPFNPHWPADRVPPSFFLSSPSFDIIWSDHDWY